MIMAVSRAFCDADCQFMQALFPQIIDSYRCSDWLSMCLSLPGKEGPFTMNKQTKSGAPSMRRDRGFSLIELLIVVAIILIIATIAIPSLLRSRQAAQESSAVAQVRTINTAEVTYLSSNQGSYGDVVSLVSQGLLDNRFTGSVSGYAYTVSASGTDYTVTAMPTSANAGRFGYYSLPDAVIHYSTATSGCGGPNGQCFPGSQSGAPVG